MDHDIITKTICIDVTDIYQKRIFDSMTITSKNIVNCTIFNTTIYTKYKNEIYKHIYNIIENMENILDIDKCKIEQQIYDLYDIKYKEYVANKDIIKNNNEIIYKFIKN